MHCESPHMILFIQIDGQYPIKYFGSQTYYGGHDATSLLTNDIWIKEEDFKQDRNSAIFI